MDEAVSQDVIDSSQETVGAIQAINRDTVHRICSGQVVLSLAIAVKELVENAIDAGASIIDVRLKDYGSELIEVSDNGMGVMKDNFQTLTLKHYTSKIRQFSDLEHLATLGFRGEALSSLCALSDLTVLTKHRDAENATRITYDRNGRIAEETLSAREQGTTVALSNLFSTLPVRRKEFVKNLKREFNKMCQLLYAYCLVSKGIKFSCSNTTSKGSKSTIVATEGSKTVRENIINVFSSKQIASLIDVETARRSNQDVLDEFGLKLFEGEELPFTLEFLVSSVTHGSGRSTTDRQFFYVNSRPCEPSKIIKLVNDIYRQYNSNQYPFVYLNITSGSSLVDVNVTPDKRQVFLEKEKLLLATVKASLVEAFKVFPSSYKVENLEASQSLMRDFFKLDGRGLKRSSSDEAGLKKKGSITERFQKRSKTENSKGFNGTLGKVSRDVEDEIDEQLESLMEIAKTLVEDEKPKPRLFEKLQVKMEDPNPIEHEMHIVDKHGNVDKPIREGSVSCEGAETIEMALGNCLKGESLECTTRGLERPSKNESDRLENLPSDGKLSNPRDLETPPQNMDIGENESGTTAEERSEVEYDESSSQQNRTFRKSPTLDFSLESIREALAVKAAKSDEAVAEEIRVRFRAEIAPDKNKTAEEELSKQISKDDFKNMEVIGQFNMGFIIAKLNKDLFIIDQHATDEKYNFEQLQATTVMESQVLVNPKPLQLTAGNESLLIENEGVFKKNGFSFKIDETAPGTKKVLMTAVPMSRNCIFGKDEIDEMLFMLKESNTTTCRPSRIRGMLASRACRKSVMIGDALSKNDMRRLVDHMGEIEQPWNCPHGRPTMRHLINMDLIQQK